MLSKTTLSTMLVGVITLGCLVNAQAQDPKALIQKMAAAYKNVKSYSGVLEIEQIAAGKKQTATITIMYSGQKAYQHSIATGGKTPEDVLTVDDGKFAYFQKNTKEYMKGPHQNVPKFTMGESIAKGLSVPQVQLKLMPSTPMTRKSSSAMATRCRNWSSLAISDRHNAVSKPEGSLT